jgi:ribosomal protein S15P/S13E
MPRITLPGRASRTAPTKAVPTAAKPATEAGNGAEAPPKEAQPAGAKAPGTTPPAGTATAATATAATTPAAKPEAGTKTPDPNLQERIEGLQGWMAEIERKQARLTYFGGIALLLALAAAGVALYFGLTTHSDSATKTDLDALTNRVNSLQGAVSKNSKDTQNALNASIAQLQQSISGLQKQQAQAQANLSTLQSQVAAGALNKNAAGATPGVTPTVPGAATTTTTPENGKTP